MAGPRGAAGIAPWPARIDGQLDPIRERDRALVHRARSPGVRRVRPTPKAAPRRLRRRCRRGAVDPPPTRVHGDRPFARRGGRDLAGRTRERPGRLARPVRAGRLRPASRGGARGAAGRPAAGGRLAASAADTHTLARRRQSDTAALRAAADARGPQPAGGRDRARRSGGSDGGPRARGRRAIAGRVPSTRGRLPRPGDRPLGRGRPPDPARARGRAAAGPPTGRGARLDRSWSPVAQGPVARARPARRRGPARGSRWQRDALRRTAPRRYQRPAAALYWV